ncbi:MAG: UbiD family decarboxylase [Planctomycetota bacterium]|nr:UbiD family decarboxylase [Planctomycetota bacterium]
MHPTTRDFVAALDRAGELRRIPAGVSPVLEIAQITDLVSKSRCAQPPSAAAQRNDPRFWDRGGQALLFTSVQGSDIPVLINAWGSYRRMEMALGCPQGFESIAQRIGELVKPQPPRSLGEAFQKLKQVLPLLRVPPRRRKGMGLCQEVVLKGDAADVRRLPIIRCWPHDGDSAALGYPPGINDSIPGVDARDESIRGRYITLAGIHTIHARDRDDPRPASHNIGMYRVQVLGPRTLAMHWHMHHDGAAHWRSWKARGEPMPVAIALGGESVMPYAATCPLPPGISELLMAGYLNGKGIPLCRARTVPLWVPASAEIIIEGYVSHEAGPIGWDPSRPDAGPLGPGAVFEGPFGDHTGFYSLPDRYPILTVTAITHRRDPIYPTTIVGLPPQEDYYLGKATERIMLPLLKVILPDIEDYDLPLFGAFHNAAFLRIRKHYPFHARRVMHGVWGAGQMSWTKTIAVVDDEVDVHDTSAVLRAVGQHCHPARDSELVRGPIDILDHATPFLGGGSKLGLDATRKSSAEERHTEPVELPAGACDPDAIGPVQHADADKCLARVRDIPGVLDARIPDELGGWWLLIRARKIEPGDGAKVIQALGAVPNEAPLPRWTIVLGPDASLDSFDDALFHWAANMSPERDRFLSRCGRRVAFDATPKLPGDERSGWPVRAWPPLIRMDDATAALVRARWAEYGLPAPAPTPDITSSR